MAFYLLSILLCDPQTSIDSSQRFNYGGLFCSLTFWCWCRYCNYLMVGMGKRFEVKNNENVSEWLVGCWMRTTKECSRTGTRLPFEGKFHFCTFLDFRILRKEVLTATTHCYFVCIGSQVLLFANITTSPHLCNTKNSILAGLLWNAKTLELSCSEPKNLNKL